MILSPFLHRPDLRREEAAERKVTEEIKRRAERSLAEFERRCDAIIAKALRR